MYSIKLSPEGRILSACREEFNPGAELKLTKLPEGELTDWVYRGGKLSLEPLPHEPLPEPVNSIEELRELINDNTLALAELLGGGI